MAEASEHPTSPSDTKAELRKEQATDLLVQKLGISPELAERLYGAGLHSPEMARTASPEVLKGLHLSEEEEAKIRSGTPTEDSSPDSMLEKWLENRAKTPRKGGHKRKGHATTPEQSELFKRWVAGDDAAFASWLKPTKPGESHPSPEVVPVPPPEAIPTIPSDAVPAETPATEPAAPVAPVPKEEPAPEAPKSEVPTPEPSGPPKGGETPETPSAPTTSSPPAGDLDRKFSAWIDTVTGRLQEGKIDVPTLLQEGNAITTELRTAMKHWLELEEELAHVKKGSVAVIKFVRSKEARLREEAIAAKQEEIETLKAKLASLESAAPSPSAKGDEPHKGKDSSAPAVSMAPMVEALKAKEKVLLARERELTAKTEELMLRATEAEQKNQANSIREQEFVKWEQTVRLKEEQVKSLMLKYEADKKALQDPEVLEKLRHLENLDSDIAKRESEIKARESFLLRKLEELQGKEREVVDAEVAKSEAEIQVEISQERAKTGIPRLDDLLYGGLPIGCNVLINGTKHTGKEVMAKFLAAEGLKKAVPVLWVLTDTDPDMVREEMKAIIPTYPEYERRGLVRYIDLFSMNMGSAKEQANVTLISINEPGALQKLATTVDAISVEFLRVSKYYRLIFQSLSTVTAYLDTRATLTFLQPFTGKRLREKAICYYLVESGMHNEGDMEMLEHVMTGSFNLKVEQMKTFLSVKGLLDEVQSRAWVNYNHSRSMFSMGSFSLDHIR